MKTAQKTGTDWTPGTAGNDVMTVHKVRNGKPICGAPGKVDQWQRTVNCPHCLPHQ